MNDAKTAHETGLALAEQFPATRPKDHSVVVLLISGAATLVVAIPLMVVFPTIYFFIVIVMGVVMLVAAYIVQATERKYIESMHVTQWPVVSVAEYHATPNQTGYRVQLAGVLRPVYVQYIHPIREPHEVATAEFPVSGYLHGFRDLGDDMTLYADLDPDDWPSQLPITFLEAK